MRDILGISKCREVARQFVWWLSIDVNNMIETCYVFNKFKAIRKGHLKPTLWPEQPWHTVGMDLFEYGWKSYLLVIDYQSRFPEVVEV